MIDFRKDTCRTTYISRQLKRVLVSYGAVGDLTEQPGSLRSVRAYRLPRHQTLQSSDTNPWSKGNVATRENSEPLVRQMSLDPLSGRGTAGVRKSPAEACQLGSCARAPCESFLGNSL